MATQPIKHISRLIKEMQATGIEIVSLNSAGIVSPQDLQKVAQPIIDAFDDSPEAEDKKLIDDASSHAKVLLNDPKSEFYHLNLALGGYLADQIKVAVPAYIPPPTDEIKQGTIDKVDDVKPTVDEIKI